MKYFTFYSRKKESIGILIALIFLLFGIVSPILSQSRQTFTSSGTFTVPSGVTSIIIECWGAGGGGSNINDNGVRGAGGGGGAYANTELAVIPGNTYDVVVGTGGTGSNNGGNSMFNSNSVIASGGSGASVNLNIAGNGGSIANSIGTTIFAGGNGAIGGTLNSGGGGGAAGSTGTGNDANEYKGGSSKTMNGGSGGYGVNGSNNGNNGVNYGGGGSGAVTNSEDVRVGGSGADGLVVISWSDSNCLYNDNTSSSIIFTPSVNMPTYQQAVSTNFVSNQYFILNVIKGLTYQVYTCGNPSQPLKMAIYEEGNSTASAIKTSTSNTGNTCNTNPNNVFTSFSSPISGQVRVLINSLVDCSSTSIDGLMVYLNVSEGSNVQDDQNAAGVDSWIGHIYDGMDFKNYIGYYSQTETFKEGFGSGGTWPNSNSDDATNFNIYSNGTISGAVRVMTFSVHYRMNSTRKGLYVADMTSDDGNRLYVDGNLVFSDWTNHSPVTHSNVLFPLTGNSSLVFDYFENSGQNVVGFNNIVKVFSNSLSTNTSQSLCVGDMGLSISGDVYGTLPSGISLSGTGYQWTYSTTPTGIRTNISGATSESFTPNTSIEPFNTPGTYYLFRNSILSSINNVSPNPYIATLESNMATLVVNPLLPVSVSISASKNPSCEGSSVTFTATSINEGTSPHYQWKVNGNDVGGSGSSYSYVPTKDDIVNCELLSNITPCSTGNPAISNSIKVLITDPSIPISVSIAASENPVCSGNTVIFTATPINGGSKPAYQWKVNGIDVGTDNSTYSYVPTNNDQITCVLISDAAECGAIGSPATSNTLTMTVFPSNTITLSSSTSTENQSVCINNALTTIKYNTTGATGAIFSGLPSGITGTWAGDVVTISGTPTVSGTFNYSVTLTGGYCIATASGTITVNALPLTPSASNTTVCIGNTTTLTASGAVSGNKYVWYDVATGGTPLKTSSSYTDNTYVTSALSKTTNYWVAILNSTGCEGVRTQITATFPAVSTDDQTTAGIDSWIGHVYDGNSFSTYYGQYTESELFNQSFGGTNNCFSINSSLGTRSIYTETFSAKYRMNSTKKGLYVVDLGSDDGSRLTVDGAMVYNNWTAQGFSTRSRVLMSLSGNSSLLYEFYENSGSNQVVFLNLTQVLSNTLSVNTIQSIYIGNIGTQISGDVFGALQTGITLSGTGYQWSYSTSLSGTRVNIDGATEATFIPNTNNSPFNTAGTYYLYRNAKLSSANNVSPTTYVATNESNVATITIEKNFWTGVTDTDWGKSTNWTANSVPLSGQDIEFATVTNNKGTSTINDLVLDTDRTVGSVVNLTTKRLVIPAAKCLTVNNTIKTDGNVDRIYIQSSSTLANGSLIFHNLETEPLYGTVEMYTKAYYNSNGPTGFKYKWQYFGIPLRSTVCSPTLNGSYIREYNELGITSSACWVSLNNASTLTPLSGYEITQTAPKTIYFQGIIENRDLSRDLTNTTDSYYHGQHIISNPYTAAISIQDIDFVKMNASVYLYNTGSSADWSSNSGSTAPGFSPGQYVVAPKFTTGESGIPTQIPSMQGFLVFSNAGGGTINIPYSSVAIKNTTMQRVKQNSSTNNEGVVTVIDVKSAKYSDRMWLITNAGCTHNFDNGYDGYKIIGSSDNPQIYAVETDGNYQVSSVDNIDNTEIAFQAGLDEAYTLTFTHKNIESQYPALYLIDLLENKTIDISESGTTYDFTSNSGSDAQIRFKIVTSPGLSTGTKNELESLRPLTVVISNKTIRVQNNTSEKGNLLIYDMSGKLIDISSFNSNSETLISKSFKSGVYSAKAITNRNKFVVNFIWVE